MKKILGFFIFFLLSTLPFIPVFIDLGAVDALAMYGLTVIMVGGIFGITAIAINLIES